MVHDAPRLCMPLCQITFLEEGKVTSAIGLAIIRTGKADWLLSGLD